MLTGPAQHPLTPEPADLLMIGTAYSLDYRNIPRPNHETRITIPPSSLEFLKLYTTVHLFGDHKLTAHKSGLTLPVTLDRRQANTPERQARFWYNEGSVPGLNFEYIPT